MDGRVGAGGQGMTPAIMATLDALGSALRRSAAGAASQSPQGMIPGASQGHRDIYVVYRDHVAASVLQGLQWVSCISR